MPCPLLCGVVLPFKPVVRVLALFGTWCRDGWAPLTCALPSFLCSRHAVIERGQGKEGKTGIRTSSWASRSFGNPLREAAKK
jgi:hypothetical protein